MLSYFSTLSSWVRRFTGSLHSALAHFLGTSSRVSDLDRTQLRDILLKADVAPTTVQELVRQLDQVGGQLPAREGMAQALRAMCAQASGTITQDASYILMVGINGSGKTSTCVKVARWYAKQGKRVAIAAADTFRAAAQEQLARAAHAAGVEVLGHGAHTDPGAVVYQAAQAYKTGAYDIIIIDTAGRLQTKEYLMRELTRLYTILGKQTPHVPVHTWLVIDALLGSNSLDQARVFSQAVPVQGLVITKCDSAAKGGMVLSIMHTLRLPVYMMTFGEQVDDCAPFDQETFITSLLA